MHKHGSESYFVLGGASWGSPSEGDRTLAVAAETLAPPFLFTRMGPVDTTFRMVDLLLFALEGKKSLLAPLG
jgi:hypothetical protein